MHTHRGLHTHTHMLMLRHTCIHVLAHIQLNTCSCTCPWTSLSLSAWHTEGVYSPSPCHFPSSFTEGSSGLEWPSTEWGLSLGKARLLPDGLLPHRGPGCGCGSLPLHLGLGCGKMPSPGTLGCRPVRGRPSVTSGASQQSKAKAASGEPCEVGICPGPGQLGNPPLALCLECSSSSSVLTGPGDFTSHGGGSTHGFY